MPVELQAMLGTQQWVWVDYAIALVVMISSLVGMMRGFVKEAFALVTWIAAVWVGMQYSRDVSPLFQNQLQYPSARIAVAFVALFILTLLVGSLISFILGQLVQKTGLSGSDRLVGLLFGAARGAVLVAAVVLLAGLTPLPEDSWWKQSQLIPPFQTLAVWLKEHIPSGLAGYTNYH